MSVEVVGFSHPDIYVVTEMSRKKPNPGHFTSDSWVDFSKNKTREIVGKRCVNREEGP